MPNSHHAWPPPDDSVVEVSSACHEVYSTVAAIKALFVSPPSLHSMNPHPCWLKSPPIQYIVLSVDFDSKFSPLLSPLYQYPPLIIIKPFVWPPALPSSLAFIVIVMTFVANNHSLATVLLNWRYNLSSPITKINTSSTSWPPELRPLYSRLPFKHSCDNLIFLS